MLPKYQAVVFVHGCYWHRHPGCKDATTPKTNVSFWTEKFAENLERDRRVERQLGEQGWRVLVVWECELTRRTLPTIERVATWLRQGATTTSATRYDQPAVDRGSLLAIAEKKVRYRLASYDEKLGKDE